MYVEAVTGDKLSEKETGPSDESGWIRGARSGLLSAASFRIWHGSKKTVARDPDSPGGPGAGVYTDAAGPAPCPARPGGL